MLILQLENGDLRVRHCQPADKWFGDYYYYYIICYFVSILLLFVLFCLLFVCVCVFFYLGCFVAFVSVVDSVMSGVT